MQTSTRRRIAATVLLLGIPALSACGRGFNEQTDSVYQPAEGTNSRDGEVDVLGTLVVTTLDGRDGTFIASLSNENQTRPDRLTGLTMGLRQVDIGTLPPIAPGGLLNLADPAIGGIPVRGPAVVPGGFVRVRLTFENAEPVSMLAPVILPSGPYAYLRPTGLEAPSASSTPKG